MFHRLVDVARVTDRMTVTFARCACVDDDVALVGRQSDAAVHVFLTGLKGALHELPFGTEPITVIEDLAELSGDERLHPGGSRSSTTDSRKGIPVVQTAAKPWSTDENLHHISYEAGILEEPDVTPPKDMWKLMKDLQEASADGPQCIDLTFTRGVTSELVVYKPSTEQREVVGKATDVLDIFLQLNSLARAHGIGRIDIVEN
ncbi:hypothetical protein PTTG_08264 [Puccinia triticina 1-1 BBBD Race 1]|uniref:argininosuccinate synthase n=1 Tax=Puccinia triticina (isolate 1-1 / race 1 (BBBD)) TaxID=630390 RepID=A0A180G8T4_PUCT1|nr:hypothetical protein PTTG_08264 [Puccinia triticina 1-1 BBBD Race 1]